MKKRMVTVMLAAVLAVTLTACGGSSETSSEASSSSSKDSGKTVTIKFAHTVPSNTATAKCIQRFCDEVTEESGGKLTIECYADSQLGGDQEICDQIYNGASMMNYVDPALMEDYYADYSIIATPYFFESADEIKEFAWSEQGQKMSDECAQSGVKCLDNMGGYYGARDIMAKKEISTPADMKNVKFRVPNTTMWIAMADAWGASATTVSYSEVYTALSQGVVDAVENPVPSMLSSSFQEVCPYLNLTHHMYAANGIIMSNSLYESLDTDMQELLTKKAKEFDDWTFDEISREEKEAIQTMKDGGVTVNDNVDIEAFKEASSSIYDTYEGWSDSLVEDCKAQMEEIRSK